VFDAVLGDEDVEVLLQKQGERLGQTQASGRKCALFSS
jgi:hypothetical protein